eukprot:2163984-Rhodomonas_salina.2
MARTCHAAADADDDDDAVDGHATKQDDSDSSDNRAAVLTRTAWPVQLVSAISNALTIDSRRVQVLDFRSIIIVLITSPPPLITTHAPIPQPWSGLTCSPSSQFLRLATHLCPPPT